MMKHFRSFYYLLGLIYRLHDIEMFGYHNVQLLFEAETSVHFLPVMFLFL